MSKKVLFIAEDDVSVRKIVKIMMELEGHAVALEASSLSEALEKAKKAKDLGVEVAILDGSLSKQTNPEDGPQIAEALRKEVPGIKIVSFSGASELVHWGDYNLRKPTDLNELASSIGRI